MKTKKLIIIFSLAAVLGSLSAVASYELSKNGKPVICNGDDNVTVELNANRTKFKFTIEGESDGYKRIKDTKSDDKTYTSYETVEGTLTLSDELNTFLLTDDLTENPYELKCKTLIK